MSGPVKFDGKSKIVKLVGNHPHYSLKLFHDNQQAMTLVELIESVLVLDLPFHDFPKSEKFCMSRPVNFDQKSKIVKLVGNHPHYSLKLFHDNQQAMTLVELI